MATTWHTRGTGSYGFTKDPDLAKFNMTHLEDDVIALMWKVVSYPSDSANGLSVPTRLQKTDPIKIPTSEVTLSTT
jgi:hypothetical protein